MVVIRILTRLSNDSDEVRTLLSFGFFFLFFLFNFEDLLEGACNVMRGLLVFNSGNFRSWLVGLMLE